MNTKPRINQWSYDLNIDTSKFNRWFMNDHRIIWLKLKYMKYGPLCPPIRVALPRGTHPRTRWCPHPASRARCPWAAGPRSARPGPQRTVQPWENHRKTLGKLPLFGENPMVSRSFCPGCWCVVGSCLGRFKDGGLIKAGRMLPSAAGCCNRLQPTSDSFWDTVVRCICLRCCQKMEVIYFHTTSYNI